MHRVSNLLYNKLWISSETYSRVYQMKWRFNPSIWFVMEYCDKSIGIATSICIWLLNRPKIQDIKANPAIHKIRGEISNATWFRGLLSHWKVTRAAVCTSLVNGWSKSLVAQSRGKYRFYRLQSEAQWRLKKKIVSYVNGSNEMIYNGKKRKRINLFMTRFVQLMKVWKTCL